MSRRIVRLYFAGELAAAEQAAEALVSLGQSLGSPSVDVMSYYGSHLMIIRINQGRVEDVVPMIRLAVESDPAMPVYQAVLAAALARTGGVDEAKGVLFELAKDGAVAIPRNLQWYPAMMMLADVAEITSNSAVAAELAEQLRPFSGRLAVHGTGVTYPVDLALSQLAIATGDFEGADAIAGQVIVASRDMRTPIFRGRALVLRGAARHRLGMRGSSIDPIVSEALALADRTGARLIYQEAERFGLF